MAPVIHSIPFTISSDRFLPGGVFTEEADGSHTMTERCAVAAGNIAFQLPPRWSTHPQFSTLLRTTAQAIRQEGNILEFQLRYQGIVGGLEPTVPEKQFYRVMADEPIETHKDFISKIGGTPSSPLNNAIFDATGRFQFFPVNAGQSLAGVQAYKSASFGIKLTYAQLTPPSTVRQPYVISGTGGSVKGAMYLPQLDNPMNYLVLPPYWDQVGGYYKVVYEYLVSGSRGWNSLIYPSS